MKHKIVTFYAVELPNVQMVIDYQKKVFNHFGSDIEQVPFTDKKPHPHSEAMTDYLLNNEWDSISIFDVDSVITSTETIERAIDIIKDKNTIYGNVQATHNELPFAAPNFLNLTKEVWVKTLEIWDRNKDLHRDIFRYQTYYRNDKEIICDVAERFNIEHRKIGTNIVVSYPVKNEGTPEWKYTGGNGYKDFEWGNGTWFDSKTFHGSEIRYPHKQQVFFDICEKILNNG